MKQQLIQAAKDIRSGNSLAQTAINGLSGEIDPTVYAGMYKTLQYLQDPATGLEAQAKKLDVIIAETPDDPAPSGDGN